MPEPVRVRLVAVDLDGTLVRSDRTISDRSRAALRACAEVSVPVVVVTARRWAAARPLLSGLAVHGHAVVVGGCAVREVDTGRVVAGSSLPARTVAAVVDAVAAAGLQPLVALDHGERHLAAEPSRDGPAASRWLTLRGGAAVRVPLARLGDRDATRVLAMGSVSRIRAAARRLVGFPCLVTVQPCIIPRDNRGERAYELHASRASKGTALRDLCRQLGVHPGEVMAIGDAPSDLPMLEMAGIPVLMGQAEPGLRRPGTVVAPAADDDGVAWAVERFVLDGGWAGPGPGDVAGGRAGF